MLLPSLLLFLPFTFVSSHALRLDRRLVDTKSSGGSIKNNITNAGPPDDGVATCDTNKLWRSTPENWKAGQTDEFLKRRLDQGSTQRTNLLQSLVDDYATGVDNFVCNEESVAPTPPRKITIENRSATVEG